MSELSKRLRQSAENQVTVSGGVVKLHHNIYAMAADEIEQNEGLIERQGSEIALLMKDNEVQDIEISRLRESNMELLAALKKAKPIVGATAAEPNQSSDIRVLRTKIYEEIARAIANAEKVT